MWIFLPGGLLMPSTFPKDKVDPKYLGPDGNFDLQVRVRAVSHVENFIRDYVEPMGLAHSEIQMTPEMDYNARIYMRSEDFAQAMAQAVREIDYSKFKPTAEAKNEDGEALYAEGKAYHSVLNSIWGTLTRLGRPGGKWGPRSYSVRTPGAAAEKDLFSDYDFAPRTFVDDDSEIDRILDRVWDLPSRDWVALLSLDELDLVRFEYDRQVASERTAYKPTRSVAAVKKARKKARR